QKAPHKIILRPSVLKNIFLRTFKFRYLRELGIKYEYRF
ncbi:hypothetical protein CP8484711_2210, partial [Chlamydia psittaci 84-8471/1]